VLEVLDRYRAEHRVECPVGKRELRGIVQVLNKVVIQPVVGGQFLLVHAVAHHPAQLHVFRQVRDPAAHQVEDIGTRAQVLPVELSEPLAEALVDVLHEPGLAVEGTIRAVVFFRPLLFGENQLGAGGRHSRGE